MAHGVSTRNVFHCGVLTVTLVNLVVILLAKQSMAQEGGGREEYACWGGCYNQCILGSQGAPSLPCYFSCLEGCVVRPAATDYDNYCQIGCSLMKCIKDHPDGQKVENCLDNCNTKVCANNI